ncbi:uncharacterized protein LOC127788085 [Diospyros lotus]|uniref:uncharacterized protein LOC127788085 n=1 Tax=Diospyros lotus TaxID=55363 RepID=UPI002251EAC5|nr:uncharacterized protein LOC127788085 [Diospyros lotus]
MVFQQSGESLKDYIERFRCKVNNVESPSDESILIAISVGLRKDGKLYKSIYKSPIRDLGEFYERAAKEDRIFATERNKEDFGRPNPLRTPDKYRSKSKFCAYHNEAGHTTSECWVLKDTIEELIRRGRLWISNISHERYVREASHLLLVGDGSQEGSSNKAKMALDDIFFTKSDSKDVHWPHNDAFVVRARIGNIEVQKIMVDTGSLINVMYRGCFDQMGLGPDQLIASPEPLYGFTGNAVIPKGCIKLSLTVGESSLQATAKADFLIINSPSIYNVVMGEEKKIGSSIFFSFSISSSNYYMSKMIDV